MKQFKADWQTEEDWRGVSYADTDKTIDHLITQHNALCDYLEDWHNQALEQAEVHEVEVEKETITLDKERWGNLGNTVVIPKSEWYKAALFSRREAYERGIRDASKAFGVIIKLED